MSASANAQIPSLSLFLRDNQVKLGRLFPLPCCPLIFEQETGQRHKYLLTYLFHTCPQRLWKPDDENAAGQDCHDDVCASWDSLVLPLHGKHRRHPGILLQVYLLQALQVSSVQGLSKKNIIAMCCHVRCESEPADLPKKATLPSIKEDTLSYLDEERVSQSSQGKASREDSLVSGRAVSRRWATTCAPSSATSCVKYWGALSLKDDYQGQYERRP